eukprot:6185233-Pleurochrysis_carterae.AAC.2
MRNRNTLWGGYTTHKPPRLHIVPRSILRRQGCASASWATRLHAAAVICQSSQRACARIQA